MKLLARGLEAVLQAITACLLLALAAVVVLAVAFRTLGSSLIWYDEVAAIMLAWLTYYAAALAALRRAHMGFSGLLFALPLALRRALFLLAEALVLGFFLVVAWYGWTVMEFMAGETLVSLPWVSVPFTQSVIPVAAALFVLAEIASLPEAWANLTAGRSAEDIEIEQALADAGHHR